VVSALVGAGEVLGPNPAVAHARKTRLSFSDRDQDTRIQKVFVKASPLGKWQAILGQ
jgi:hypothetical protein